MDGDEYQFQEWLSCPACGGDGDVSILAYETDIVIECYGCGMTSEYAIGEDVPVADLDAEEIGQTARDG